MKRKDVERAIVEAQKFIERSEVYLTELGNREWLLTGTAASGALRRQSLELTRSLSQVRRRE